MDVPMMVKSDPLLSAMQLVADGKLEPEILSQLFSESAQPQDQPESNPDE